MAQQPQLPQFSAVVTCHPVKTLGALWNKKFNCWAAEIQYQARIGKHFTFKTSPIAPLSSLKLKDNTVKRRRGAAEFLKTPQSQHFVLFFSKWRHFSINDNIFQLSISTLFNMRVYMICKRLCSIFICIFTEPQLEMVSEKAIYLRYYSSFKHDKARINK